MVIGKTIAEVELLVDFEEMRSMDGAVLVFVKGGELLLIQIYLHDRLMDFTYAS